MKRIGESVFHLKIICIGIANHYPGFLLIVIKQFQSVVLVFVEINLEEPHSALDNLKTVTYSRSPPNQT